MVHVQLFGKIPGRKAAEVYMILKDFETYSKHVEAVRSIVVDLTPTLNTSTWDVDFHGGVMRWKEEDIYLPDQLAIQFRQIEGDLDDFSGEWKVSDTDEGCRVDFRADFDLGVPGLAETLEPIADAALRENIRGILVGLLGAVQFE